MINEFKGKYFFLSNFYEAPVIYDRIRYNSSEAAFQAQKCANYEDRKAFSTMNPSEAKKAGRRVKLRSDWEYVKRNEMFEIVRAKFLQNATLGLKLLETGDEYLEEGNDWGDTTWGTVNGEGQNLLGKILMEVRDYIRRD